MAAAGAGSAQLVAVRSQAYHKGCMACMHPLHALLDQLLLPLSCHKAHGCAAMLCSLHRAINEEMKLAATHAIAALAKRPVMKRRPSAGDLLKLAGPHQGPVAAGAGAPAKQDAASADAAGAAGAANANGTAAADTQPNGALTAAAAGRAESTVSSSTLSTDTAATAGVSGSEASSAAPPSPEKHHHHTRSGSTGRGSGHMRRKSYGG